VTRAGIERLLHAHAGRPATQRNLHGVVRRLYRWARKQGLVGSDPTADIETSGAPARERSLSLEELAAVWQSSAQLWPDYRDATRLLLLTGQRRGEVAGMRWSELDLGRGLWTLPAGRTKARRQHVVPLPALAVALLKARQKASAPGSEDRVLAPEINWSRLKRGLDQHAGVQGWRLHQAGNSRLV
jgi:integrase